MSTEHTNPNQPSDAPINERDVRFRSGRWRGFWIQGPTRSKTELDLTFRDGQVLGDGHDWVGDFLLRGTYDVNTGKVQWTKRYLGAHTIEYDGSAETTNGIWGLWTIRNFDKGGFQIWPDEIGDQAPAQRAREEQPMPQRAPKVYEADPALVGSGSPFSTSLGS